MLRQEGTGDLIPRADPIPNRPHYQHPGGPVGRPDKSRPAAGGVTKPPMAWSDLSKHAYRLNVGCFASRRTKCGPTGAITTTRRRMDISSISLSCRISHNSLVIRRGRLNHPKFRRPRARYGRGVQRDLKVTLARASSLSRTPPCSLRRGMDGEGPAIPGMVRARLRQRLQGAIRAYDLRRSDPDKLFHEPDNAPTQGFTFNFREGASER